MTFFCDYAIIQFIVSYNIYNMHREIVFDIASWFKPRERPSLRTNEGKMTDRLSGGAK